MVSVGHWQMSQAQGELQRSTVLPRVWLHVAEISSVEHIVDILCTFTFLKPEHIMGVNNVMLSFNIIIIPHSNCNICLHTLFSISVSLSGRVAALNMLGKPTAIESVPFFWTVLLGKSIRYTGRVFAEEHFSLALKCDRLI